MVFLSIVNFVRCRGPDEFWRKRKIFKLAAVSTLTCCFLTKSSNYLLYLCFKHFYGRRRNCYSIAIRGVHRALQHATAGRQLRKIDVAEVR